jgi:hypothetical protein
MRAGWLRLALASAPLLVGACQLPTVGDGDAGTGNDAGAATEAGSTDIVGADCTTVATGVTLCAAVSACPSYELDPRLFPHCGFRIAGSALDLECYCTGILCPIGVATSCADVATLVRDQTEDTVCAEEGLGLCTSLAGSTTGGTGSCNPTCTDGCGNTPACRQACGC